MQKRILSCLVCALFICSVFAIAFKINKGWDVGEQRRDQGDSSLKYDNVSKKVQLIITIDISAKTLYLFQDGKCIRQYPIAAGKPESPSPLGTWKIVKKGTWGEGFGGRWLGLNVPWGTYGIHGTIFPESIGSSASHGCIRMFNGDVRDLYSRVPIGTPVIIENGNLGPFGFEFKDIEIGDRGANVLAVQRKLEILGYYKGQLSGIYHDDMKFAIHKFQKDHKLPVENTITADDFQAMGFVAIE